MSRTPTPQQASCITAIVAHRMMAVYFGKIFKDDRAAATA